MVIVFVGLLVCGLCVLTLRLWFCGGGFVDAFVVSLGGGFLVGLVGLVGCGDLVLPGV